ncbi:hypothetical protein DH2020_038475 [Rehmannia glutinosa]|uniref:Uncharacterized protein n=1 Tax=Rehmannia glutinosa TaxID=99300 RepID=A0ABR0V129_REHGL
MGCGVSRLDGNSMVLPAKLRPLFLYRLETRRHTGALKDSISTPSKKELLLHDHDRDEDEKSSSSDKNATCNNKIAPSSPKDSLEFQDRNGKGPGKPEKEAYDKHDDKNAKENDEKEVEDVLTDGEIDGGDDKVDDDDERRKIGHDDDDDDGVFPGSPSFRVYFKDDGQGKHNDIGHNDDAFKNTISSDDAESSKESCEKKKVMKAGRKKKSFRKVLPKGGQAAVKNLFHYKSCYTSSQKTLN